MNASRANKISEVLKNVTNLGKSIKTATGLKQAIPPNAPDAIGQPVQGSGFVRILMYIIAGLLLIGIILLGVDQWITPIFQKSPGAPGYIPVPGTDTSENYWLKASDVKDIIVGIPPPRTDGQPAPLSTAVIEGQSSYSITVDVLIMDEYPQDIGTGQNQRIFFTMSQTVDNPSLRMALDNDKNTVLVTCFDADGLQQSVKLDNVPIHTPFRVGITVTPHVLEGYLNGLLVQTRQLTSVPKPPTTGDKIFAPANIIVNKKIMSRGISVLNVRCFGYKVPSSEMRGRMDDLSDKSSFKLVTISY